MSNREHDSLQQLFARLSRDLLADIPTADRAQFNDLLQRRAEELLRANAGSGDDAFASLVGLDGDPLPWTELSPALLENDFDDSVAPTQLHSAADLYFIYQHDRMKVFQVADALIKLFHDGRIRISRGPGARALYLMEKHAPLRYTPRHRAVAYRRTFGYGNASLPDGAPVNGNFHRQFLGFVSSIAQYFRDLRVSEVIRGGPLLDQRPYGSQATIQRLGTDLRWQIDRATFGNVAALTLEMAQYLKTVLNTLDQPDIRKAFDANTRWDVVESVSRRYLGGSASLSHRTTLADSGRRLLQFAADNPFRTRDPNLFQNEVASVGPAAEEWLAAYKMTPEGQGFSGVVPTLKVMSRKAVRAA